QSESGHPAEHAVAIEAVLSIVLLDVRRDLARRPFPDRLLEQLLFIRQVEADHMSPKSYHALRRSCTIVPRPTPSVAAALPPLTAISNRSELPTSAHNSPTGASAYVPTIRGITSEATLTLVVQESLSSMAASILVVRFPK